MYCTTTAFLSDLSRFSNFFQKVFSKFFFFKKLLIFKLFLDSLVSKDVLLTLCWHLVCHCTTWQCHTMYQTDCQKTQFQDIIEVYQNLCATLCATLCTTQPSYAPLNHLMRHSTIRPGSEFHSCFSHNYIIQMINDHHLFSEGPQTRSWGPP